MYIKVKLGNGLATICSLYMHFLVVTFGIGKGLALKKYLKDCNFHKCPSVFIKSEDISMDAIIDYGEKAMAIPFVGKPEEKQDSIRLSIFYQKVSGSVKCVTPEKLPPTFAATRYNSIRT